MWWSLFKKLEVILAPLLKRKYKVCMDSSGVITRERLGALLDFTFIDVLTVSNVIHGLPCDRLCKCVLLVSWMHSINLC